MKDLVKMVFERFIANLLLFSLSLLFYSQSARGESLGKLESFQKQSADTVKAAGELSEDMLALDFLAGKLRQGVWKVKEYPDFDDPNWENKKPIFKYEICRSENSNRNFFNAATGGLTGPENALVDLDRCNDSRFDFRTISKPAELSNVRTRVRISGHVEYDLRVNGTLVKGGCPGAGRLPNNNVSTFELEPGTSSFTIEGRDTKGGGGVYDLTICFEPLGPAGAPSTPNLVAVREMSKRKISTSLTSSTCTNVTPPETAFNPLSSATATERDQFCLNENPESLKEFFMDASALGSLGVPAKEPARAMGSWGYISVPRSFPEGYFSNAGVQIPRDPSSFASKRVEFIKWIRDEENPLRVKGVTAKVGSLTADVGFRPEETLTGEGDITPLCELIGPSELIRAKTNFELRLLVRGVVHSAEIEEVPGGEKDLDQVDLDLPYDDHIIHQVSVTAPFDDFDAEPTRLPGDDEHFVEGTKTYTARISGINGNEVTCIKTVRVKVFDPKPGECTLACTGSDEQCSGGFFANDTIPLNLKFHGVARSQIVSGNVNESRQLTTDEIVSAKTSGGANLNFIKGSDDFEDFTATVFTERGDDGLQNETYCHFDAGKDREDPTCDCPAGTALEGESCPFDNPANCNDRDFCPFLDPNYRAEITLARYFKDDYEPVPVPTADSSTGAPVGLDPSCIKPLARTWKNYGAPPAPPVANLTTGEPGAHDASCVPEVATWKLAANLTTCQTPLPSYQRIKSGKCQVAKKFRCKVTKASCLASVPNSGPGWVRAAAGRCQVASSYRCLPATRLKAGAQLQPDLNKGGKQVTMWFQDTRKVIPLAGGGFKKQNPGMGPNRRFRNLRLRGGDVNVYVKSSHGADVHLNRLCNGTLKNGQPIALDDGTSLTADRALCAVEVEPTGAKYSPEWYWAMIGPIDDPDCKVLDSARTVTTRTSGCFTGDTPITMANGREKAVSEIRIGEYVFNPHYRTGIRVKKVVKGPEPQPLFEVALNGKTIKVTEDHPFFTERGWVQTLSLKKGDKLFGEGKGKVVESVRKLPYKKPVDVWNFELDTEDPLAHIVMANGVPTGDLVTQLELKKQAKKLP